MKVKQHMLIISMFLAVIFCLLSFFIYNAIRFPLKFKQEIYEASAEFNIKPEIIASVINAESRFNKNAVSSKGAMGLMQLLPSTAEYAIKQLVASGDYNVDYTKKNQTYSEMTNELFDPKTNIRLGTFYLSYLFKKFNNFETAICAYNAGEGKVMEWLKNPEYSVDGKTLKKVPYKETARYLEKIKTCLTVYSKRI